MLSQRIKLNKFPDRVDSSNTRDVVLKDDKTDEAARSGPPFCINRKQLTIAISARNNTKDKLSGRLLRGSIANAVLPILARLMAVPFSAEC